MAITMFRCAAYGSPNVMTDTQAGGVKYDYLKGAIGTVTLGVGGAAAGITSEAQTVYKCPDCGLTLTYPMPEKMKAMIDLGVSSLEARKQLSFPWEIITQQYKNIESGSADSSIKHKTELLANSTEKSVTKEEFEAAYDLIYDMERRLGYTRGYNKPAFEDEFSPDSPMTLSDYMCWKGAIKTVIENIAKYLSVPIPDEKYRGYDLARIEGWFYAYLAFEMEAEIGKPMLFSKRDLPNINDYLDYNAFARTFLDMNKARHMFYGVNNDFSIINFSAPVYAINPNLFAKFFKIGDERIFFALPLFTIRNGRLGYWDKSYRHYGASSIRDFSSLVENYFKYYPEKVQEYYDIIRERNKAINANESRIKQIDAIDSNIKQIDDAISRYNQEIAVLQKKLFGKKKAQQQIEEINKNISEMTAQRQKMLSEKNAIPHDETVESSKDFCWRLMDKFDNFIAWKWVDE